MHVSLYSQRSPIPLPPWLRQGNDKCILLKKSVIENFPPYIKNFRQDKAENKFSSSNIFEEILDIRYRPPKNGPHFSKDLLYLSLMLRYTSASCYKLLLEYFPLPSISYLNTLCKGGLDPIKSIKCLFDKEKIDKDIVLLLDEMYLQKEVQYQEGKLIGSDKDGVMFKGIMTFMVVGLKNNVPFVIKAAPETKIDGKWISEQIDDCIKSLHDVGFRVRAVISDNHSANVAAFRDLYEKYGVQSHDNAIAHPTNQSSLIYMFYDAVHLLKNIRNNLLNSRRFIFPSFQSDFIVVPSGEITWKLLHDVHDKDKCLQANLRKARKLTFKALHPGDNKQSVSLALGVFDASTSAALQSFFPERVNAASFLRLINLW